ncbi:HAMP domain-containing sensor histidine kinase [Bacillus ndiopicus]|uniref:HAMP domain-containing sensor histidine kinase n=1 Tax=Bacillus ndiopicus TaxID=1347368 RepID=UPI0005A87EDD|nr:HAMP domain-containing sensor histidine kinase [Bacillus ndiopicus]
MKKGRGVLTLLLIFWTVFALFSFWGNANRIIGKSFISSDEFQMELRQYYGWLYEYVLVPFDAEKAKEQIKITKDEIHYYRNYYGTVEEQIENIVLQYNERLQDEGISEEVKEVAKQERDRKIEEIKKNFADDAHVEAKIRVLKERIIDNYAAEKERYRREFMASNSYKMFSYDLVNVDTGQRFFNNNTVAPNIFEQQFLAENSEYFSPLDVYPNESTSIQEIHMNGGVEEEYALVDQTIPLTVEQPKFTGTITLPKTALKDSELKRNYEGFEIFKILSYIVWVTGILTLLVLLFLVRPKKVEIETLLPKMKPLFNKLPIDVGIAIVLFGIMVLINLVEELANTIFSISYYGTEQYNITNTIELIIIFAFAVALFIAIVISSIWLLGDARDMERWKKSISLRIWQAGQDAFLNRSIGMQTFAMLIVFFLAGVGFTGALIDGKLFIIYVPLFLFIFIPTLYVFLLRMGYLSRVIKQTEDMAEGRLSSDIVVKGKSPIATHAKNLNKLRDGVRTSMTEQAKSERLKTELITNVSHDLRTPLTSIITYTDLLKKPDLSEEERSKYIDILDKKSARLKTLIEDLFDVSKMASGNVELLKQRVDLAQLLQQAVGEHEEAFTTANLDMRVNIESQPIFAYVDGQKWWRVIDNLIVNAQKYSLEGTRVYITLKQQGAEAELVVKNVAKYELMENADELTERFKRADTSRHTEGSGLGLAIAQSIVDLHGARMRIEVDGDLFKVTVAVQVAY